MSRSESHLLQAEGLLSNVRAVVREPLLLQECGRGNNAVSFTLCN